MADERIQLILDLGQSGKNAAEVRQELERLDAAAKQAGDGFGEVERSTSKATKGAKDFNRTAIEGSRILQDFAQGGLGGIINNLEGFATSIGLSGGAAGAITALGVAALVAAPAVKTLWASIIDGSNDVPKATDNLAAMNNELKINKDRLKTLSDQGVLTNAQLAEYNGLLTENVELERKANAEKERRNGLDAMRKKEGEGSAESAAIVKAAIDEAGGVDDVNNATRAKMLAESPEVRDATANANKVAGDNADAASNPLNPVAQLKALVAIKKAQRERDEATKKVADQATDLILAASKGDEAAVRELARLNGGSFGQATPEAIRAQNDEVDAAEEQGARLSRGNAKRKGQNARADALNRAGQENEAFAANEAAEGKAKDIDKILKGLDKVIATGDKALADDPKGDARRADIRERAGYGLDFKQFANDRGFSPLKSDLATAAKMVQADVKDGFSEDEAMFNALDKLLYAVNKGIEINNKRTAAARRFVAGVDNMNVPMDQGDM